ncbi:hypothetical protein V6R21_15100 [Limibacter armeniacum]|uniref:hypothetical protein n=1 Tax=Limibacter armeniacum TaxID=466084 RepID=UPI002FE68AF7
MKVTLKVTLFLLITSMSFSLCAQHDSVEVEKCKVEYDSIHGMDCYVSADRNATPVDGIGELFKTFRKTLKLSKEDRELNEFGKYFFSFIVDENGTVISVKSIRGKITRPSLDLVYDILNSTEWIPGKCGDKYVPMKMILPCQICFK